MRADRFMRQNNTRYGVRSKPGQMNGTEAKYAELLHMRTLTGEVILWHFEAMKFKIAEQCLFIPDFAVWLSDGTMDIVDVKGGIISDDALVKIKAAADKFPQFTWAIEQYKKKAWIRREF